jgi:hypothetical protein
VILGFLKDSIRSSLSILVNIVVVYKVFHLILGLIDHSVVFFLGITDDAVPLLIEPSGLLDVAWKVCAYILEDLRSYIKVDDTLFGERHLAGRGYKIFKFLKKRH